MKNGTPAQRQFSISSRSAAYVSVVESCCDAVDRRVAVVLAAHIVSRIGFLDRAKQRDLGILDRRRVAARGRLHRCCSDDLHQMVDHDIPQRADRVVEVTSILDAEVLGHRDLDAGEDSCGSRPARASRSRTADGGSPPGPSSRGSDRSGRAATRRSTGAVRRRARARTPGRARTASPRRRGRCRSVRRSSGP